MRAEDIRDQFKKLELAEKLVLVEELWDNIVESNESIPLYDWQKTELDKRLEAYGKGELKLFDANMVHENLRNKYK